MFFLYIVFLLSISLQHAGGYHVAIVAGCSSHLYATSSFSRLLVNKGHKVTYVTSKECKSRFLDTGAQLYQEKRWNVIDIKQILTSSNYITQAYHALAFIENNTEVMFQELETWLNQDNGIHRPDLIVSPLAGIFSSAIADYYNIPFVSFYGNGIKFASKANMQKFVFMLPGWINDWINEKSIIHESLVKVQWTCLNLWMNFFFSFNMLNNRRQEMLLPKFGNMLHLIRSYPTITPFYEPFVAHGEVNDFYRISLTSSVKSNDPLDSDVSKWLSNSDVPVLYMALGTSTYIEQSLIEMFAEAFEAQSDFRILWSLLEKDAFPPVHKTKDQILVKSFLPQIAVLQRREVVGFLTHCGAGSLLEAISIEIPMILFPQGRDQNMNAKKVNETGAGIYLPTPNSSDSINDVLKQFKLKLEELQINIGIVRRRIDEMDEWDKFNVAMKKLITTKSSSRIEDVEDMSETFRKWTSILISIVMLIFFLCIYVTYKCCKCVCRRSRKLKND